jgi:hypothetical protein
MRGVPGIGLNNGEIQRVATSKPGQKSDQRYYKYYNEPYMRTIIDDYNASRRAGPGMIARAITQAQRWQGV